MPVANIRLCRASVPDAGALRVPRTGVVRFYRRAGGFNRIKLVFMRQVVVASAIFFALTLIVASFDGGRFAEREAQRRASARVEGDATATTAKKNRLLPNGSDENSHILIANAASVSFGELWDVMRAAAPDKRIAWARELEQLPPGTLRNAAVKSFFKIWGELDSAAAVQGIEAIRDTRLRSLAFYAAADAAADSSLPAFAELENRLGYRPNSFSATSVLSRWAAADPPAVARFLEVHPQTTAGFFLDVGYSWANAEPEKAAEWFTQLTLPPFQDSKYPRSEDRRRLEAARGVLLAWLEKDSRAASAFAAAHADDPDLKQVLGEFGLALCTRSWEEATAFVQSLPNEGAQRAALAEIMQRAGGRVMTMREGGDEEEPEEPEIDSEKIPPWLVTLPAQLWIDHVGEIFESWDATDSSRAEAWLRSLPSDAEVKAIADYSAAASVEQAPRVFQLLPLINSASVRNDILQKFVDNLSDDPSETRSKIAALPITNQQKQMLLRRIHQPR